MDNKLALENSSSAVICTPTNNTIYLNAINHLTETDLLNGPGTHDKGAKDWGANVALWLEEFRTTALEIKNPLVVVVLILFKHNGLSGQAISSSQLCSQSILCTVFCACVMPIVWMLCIWL